MQFFKYSFIAFLLLTVNSFGQSYQGPATGIVLSGVEVNTADFGPAPAGNETPIIKHKKFMEFNSGPLLYNGERAAFDNHVYVEDKNTQLESSGDIGISVEINNFESIGQIGFVPGDLHMAVGPDHIVTTANSRFFIHSKDGTLLNSIVAEQWCSEVVSNPGAFDPQIIYDHYAGRWFMLWDSFQAITQEGWFIISYSDDENPVGTWYTYALDAAANGSTPVSNWGDYPQLGYDDQGIYISSRQFWFAGFFAYSKIRILDKSQLYAANGGPVSFTDLWDIRLLDGLKQDDLHPTISYDTGNNTAYFFWLADGSADYYSLYRITDPITNPVLNAIDIPVPQYNQAPDGEQLLTDQLIDAGQGGSGMRNSPIIRDGKLYGVHHIRNTQYDDFASIQYFVVDINTNDVIEQVEFGAEDYFYYYPAIAVDKDHNFAITYSRTAATEFVGAFYSTKRATDLPGLSESKVIKEGTGPINFNRWGDYLGAHVDPVDESNIFLYSEYADANFWGSWVMEVRMRPFPGVHAYPDNNPVVFSSLEINAPPLVKSVNIKNFGEDDLIIDGIESPVGPFTLLTNLNYPVTLSSFESVDIDIEFDPDTIGEFSMVMHFFDNDTSFAGLTLLGTGIAIVSTGDDNSVIPKEYSLSQNYPNPFNPVTRISYSLPQPGNVSIKIYDVLGNEVAILLNEEKSAGRYEVNWDAKNNPSGVYTYKLEAGEYIEVKKMVLLK